jgi:hypothetical protein
MSLSESEKWKPIDGLDTYYISSIGRVRRAAHIRKARYGTRRIEEKILSLNEYKGYPKIVLRVNGESKNFFVHRLVASAFIPNQNNLPQINHLNSIRNDNRVENLEWCSATRNQNHIMDMERRKAAVKIHQINADNGQIVNTFRSIGYASKVLKIRPNIIYPKVRTGRPYNGFKFVPAEKALDTYMNKNKQP